MAMEIFKSYNHKILSTNQKLMNFDNVDELFLQQFYSDHLDSNLTFSGKKHKYSINQFSRELNGNILFDKICCEQFDSELEFIEQYEKSGKLNTSIVNKVKKYYPVEWRECLIYYQTSFMSYIFIQFLEHECDQLIKLTNGNFKINIIYSSKISTEKNINDVIYHVLNIVEWLIVKYKKDHKLTLTILLTPMEKTFSVQLKDLFYDTYEWAHWTKKIMDDGIKPFHINTGVSSKFNDANNIILYRTDELFKVLIHELLHNLSLDAYCPLCEDIIGNELNFNVGDDDSYPVLYNEGYTEYCALMLWNFYLTQYYENNDVNKYMLFRHMIYREIINGAINCKKLFNYYQITNFDVFLTENNIVQYTNAFSYIFIKYLLLVNTYQIDFSDNKHSKAQLLNKKLKEIFNHINDYNYLFDIIIDKKCNKLKLSIYNFKGL
jgi:hypothetical protein